ncbi:hypothetical protein ACLOJK_005884 [Asimina triloba]
MSSNLDKACRENGFDAVVVGSGLGGLAAAGRMSVAGIEVCLIEKGQKWEAKESVRNGNKSLGIGSGQKEKDGLLQTKKNYLTYGDAFTGKVNAGCTVIIECPVRYVVKNPDLESEDDGPKQGRRWRVYLHNLEYVTCDFVVLSAGALGTVEILLQSERRGLRLSERLGFNDDGENAAYANGSTVSQDAHEPNKNHLSTVQELTNRMGRIWFMWRHRNTSVHPLGECNAVSVSSLGVCNHSGQVFDPNGPPGTVHAGLYVCVDVPSSWPAASAAEDVGRQLVRDIEAYKASKNCPIGSRRSSRGECIVMGGDNVVVYEETMRGYVGRMPCEAHLEMKMNPSNQKDGGAADGELLRGNVGGYLSLRGVDKENLYVVDGKVDLCSTDRRTPYTQCMHYYLLLASASGSRYILEGKKILSPYFLASYAWPESTTLHVTFKTAKQANAPPSSPREEPLNLAGKLHSSQWKCDQDASESNTRLYPVLLINGHSTESFWLPTEPTDLVRTLLEAGHEPWLLQPRLHPLHPSNSFSFDDIAQFDIPAVINKISELHGPDVKVHVVAHCVGGLQIHIAIMGGHISSTRIASLSCTNSSMFFKLNNASLFKASLPFLPIAMVILGENKILSIASDKNDSLRHRFFKFMTRRLPLYQRCTSPQCELYNGVFGSTFWHENLSPTMHQLVTEGLPRLPMAAFPQLTKISAVGHILDATGANAYMMYPERMALPTLYISGGRNLLVLPKTSYLANNYMRLHQPGFTHRRVVVDGFGHSDLLTGKESYKKVFPHILLHIKEAEEGKSESMNGEEESQQLSRHDDDEKGELQIWPWFIFPALFALVAMFLFYVL